MTTASTTALASGGNPTEAIPTEIISEEKEPLTQAEKDQILSQIKSDFPPDHIRAVRLIRTRKLTPEEITDDSSYQRKIKAVLVEIPDTNA